MANLLFILLLFETVFVYKCDELSTFYPIKYDLTITPYFETDSVSHFEARLVFTFSAFKNLGKKFQLHADGLVIDSVVLLEDRYNGTKQMDLKFKYEKEEQRILFEAKHQLIFDRSYELHVNYSGNITEDGWGLYRGFYNHEGSKRYYALTQLRPVFARRLLPCLDEPRHKALFSLRVWRLPQYIARSNMPLVDTSPRSLITGRVLDTFAETPIMSPFLLALVVFDFYSLQSLDQKFISWAVPSKIQQAVYGHLLTPKIVEAMETVAGLPFPLPKMDQIAINHLNPVAMENWGMSTFQEKNMLILDGTDSALRRQDIARFVAHEVSHYWLGNLVTVESWGSLWISEGFAMFYEYYLPSQVSPQWRLEDQMVTSLCMPGLIQDSLHDSTPLNTKVTSNEEILAKFSGLTYTKGPCIFRMVNNFISKPKADSALRRLIQEKKYSTVNPLELWRIYDEEAEELPANMETIMRSWTDKSGYPVITVSVNHSGIITFKQEKFLIDGSLSAKRVKWWVPISMAVGPRPDLSQSFPRLWLRPRAPKTTIKLGHPFRSWLLVNIQRTGFYRVNYNRDNWYQLIRALISDPASIHEINRAQLLDDSFSLARAGLLSYHIPLYLASYLVQESCYFPWAAVIPHVKFIMRRLKGHSAFDDFKEYITQLIVPVYGSLGFYSEPSDSHLTQLNRMQILDLACSLGLQSCINDAKNHQLLINQGKPSKIPPGLEYVQKCTVIEDGVSKEELQDMLNSSEDKLKILNCIPDKTVIYRYLVKSLKEDPSAVWQERLSAALERLSNIEIVFSIFMSHSKTLISRFGAANTIKYFKQLEEYLTTINQLNMVLQVKVSSQEFKTVLKSISDNILQRLKWIEKTGTRIQSWIEKSSTTNTRGSWSLVNCV